MTKHLFEEDHDLLSNTFGMEAVEDITEELQYGLDPLELLIHLEELQLMISKSMNQKAANQFRRAPRPTTVLKRILKHKRNI